VAAGDASTEEQRRRRVVKGWAFRDLSPEEIAEIKDYINGGPTPQKYAKLHTTVR
jgi:hypothetical protein